MSNMFEAQVTEMQVSNDEVLAQLATGDYILDKDGNLVEGRVSYAERDDVEIESEEKMAKKRSDRLAALRAAIREERFVHVDPYTVNYADKKGNRRELEIESCNPLLMILECQPNAPQLTAQATETRSGPARLSDEA